MAHYVVGNDHVILYWNYFRHFRHLFFNLAFNLPFGDTLFIDHLNKELLQIIVPDLFSLYSIQDY